MTRPRRRGESGETNPEHADAALEHRYRTLSDFLLICASDTPGAAGRERISDERDRLDASALALAQRASTLTDFIADLGYGDAAEARVRASVAGRSAWAPADDWSVRGPFAAPAEVVAERRAVFERRHSPISERVDEPAHQSEIDERSTPCSDPIT